MVQQADIMRSSGGRLGSLAAGSSSCVLHVRPLLGISAIHFMYLHQPQAVMPHHALLLLEP